MHMHGIRLDPYLQQMSALDAAAKAEAKRAAERTRKRLLGAASALASECDDEASCVVRLGGDDASGENAKPRNARNQDDRTKQDDPANSENSKSPFSGWA